tara:strand:+ start:474 stop:674 length:201 start_codon:yes stop_codon:yes gene_type:complete
MKLLNLSLFILFFSTSSSYAYLDPGTGSVLLQIIIGFFAAIIAFFKRVRAYFLNIFIKLKDKLKKR